MVAENILNLIEDYLVSDLRNTPFEEVQAKVDDIISYYNVITANVGGVPIFRVRRIFDQDEHTCIQHVWCPDEKYVTRMGRLNNFGESIFYAAFDPLTAIKETQIEKGDRFSLSVFMLKAMEKDNLSSIIIGFPKYYNGSEIFKIPSKVAGTFVFNEFTRSVGVGNEYLYKTTCAVAKNLLNLKGKDSIIYPSMQDFKRLNIALLKQSAESRVVFEVVFRCKLLEKMDNSKYIIEIESRYDRKEGDNDLFEYDESKAISEYELTYSSLVRNVDFSDSIKTQLNKICK